MSLNKPCMSTITGVVLIQISNKNNCMDELKVTIARVITHEIII